MYVCTYAHILTAVVIQINVHGFAGGESDKKDNRVCTNINEMIFVRS